MLIIKQKFVLFALNMVNFGKDLINILAEKMVVPTVVVLKNWTVMNLYGKQYKNMVTNMITEK